MSLQYMLKKQHNDFYRLTLLQGEDCGDNKLHTPVFLFFNMWVIISKAARVHLYHIK